MLTTGLQITGYQPGSELYRSGGRVVLRAQRLSDGQAVALETLDAEYPERQQVAGIRRDGAIAQRLAGIVGVRQVFDIIAHGNGNVVLVTRLYEETLATQLLKAGGKGLALDEVLDISLRLVQVLSEIHAQGIVHKALTPEHVLYDPATGDIGVAGFAIASELDQERQTELMSRQLEGPLPYISPEQTGRMNRDLDYRSDYYSLGVILYELLTGIKPFKADNLLEWVYSHISKLPTQPHIMAPNVPEAVSNIVVKLLAKSPDERYQSAQGLRHDLLLCADLLATGRVIAPFSLGSKDVVHRFLMPQNLYGRDPELQQILSLFESAVAGATEFCLVHGYSGVGKSALVNEIDRPLVRERGFLVRGKFEQFQRGKAHMAIADAFRGLVQQVLAEPEQQLKQWRQRLLDALNPNASLMVEMVPELELIIGSQPPVAELPPAEARNRQLIVQLAFLRTFAGNGHPVVIFLDDLQWSDTPTLELLRRLVTSRELSHLLLIGAYRSNEVGTGHPLRLLIDDLTTHRNICQLALGPLDRDSVACLVADALNHDPQKVRPLSDMLYDKALGNPFFTNELLRQLHKEGAIKADNDSGRWHWDLDAARWSGVSRDVVEFMVDNLRRLPPQTQQVLQLAACIGSTFDLQTLSLIYERPITETASALLPALKQHAILPLHSDYRLITECVNPQDFNPAYRFQHDRVQQAAYALIVVQRLQDVHLSVGRLMLQHAGDIVDEDRLIDIVGHLNEGRPLIDSQAERLNLAELNLRAALRARHSSAYEDAMKYLQVAAELLPSEPWREHPQLMRSLAVETQQCAYLTGRTEEAENWIEVMLHHAQSDLERSNILAIRTRQYATLGRMEDSILSAIKGLALLGIEFTDQPLLEDITEQQRLVLHNLGNRKIADLVNATQLEDPATLSAMRLLMEIFAAAFLSGSGNLFPYLVLKAVNLSLCHGNCHESAFAYAAYGMLLCGELDDPALGYEYGKLGLAINQHFDDVTLRARVIYVYAMFVHHWSNHRSTLTPLFRRGIEAGYQSGDLLYLAYSAQDCVIWDPTLDLETAHRLHAENLEIVRECAYQDSLDSGTLFLQMQRNLLGLTDSPYTLSDAGFDEKQCLQGMHQRQFMTGIANYHIYSAEICLLYANYDRALEHVRIQDSLIKSVMSLPQLIRFYIVAFLTLVIHFPRMDAEEQAATRQRLHQDLARMTRLADHCEDNFRHLQYLMEAELKQLEGDQEAALERYDASIEAARNSGFIHDEANACERAARHLLACGHSRSAEGYLRGAHHLYQRWGAQRKVALLEQEFPVLRELGGALRLADTSVLAGDMDLASIMKASREISGEIVLDRLLDTTLRILLQNAGGQWGCLIARRQDNLVVEAAVLPTERLSLEDVPAHSLVADSEGNQLAVPVALISRVMYSGEAVVLNNASGEGQYMQDPYVLRFRPASVLCVSLKRERFEGALYMENNLATGVFSEEREEVIKLLAAQAAVAIENASLYEQVQEYSRTLEEKVAERTARLEQVNQELQGLVDRDGLTGVANRRRGDNYLNMVWARLRRDKLPLSIIMLDVDHFKAYNDNYGHQAGDECLLAIASALNAQMKRPTDLVARYGGEEFMMILPDTDANGAVNVAEMVREAVASLNIQHAHSSAGPAVTISAGTATVTPQTEAGMELLIREADIALYRAKRMGRNQVQSAPAVSQG